MEESSRAGEAGEAVELGPGAAEDAISLEQGAGSATEATDEMKESNHSGAASNADPAPGGSRTKRKQAKAKAGKGKKRKKVRLERGVALPSCTTSLCPSFLF